jgi:hypothetical protein
MEVSPQYIAGLFDGEGSLTFRLWKTSNRPNASARPVVRVANGNRQVLELVQRQFAGTLHTYQPRYPGAALNHVVCMDSQRARRFLEAILPYLVIKRNLVWIVLCFLEHSPRHQMNIKGQQGFQGLTREEADLRAALRELTMKINGRKGKHSPIQVDAAAADFEPK